jgi:hypothetical protein
LQFFLLEKALYEIVYEAAHRLQWLAIPLQGVLDLLDESAAETRSSHRGGAPPTCSPRPATPQSTH